MLSKPTALLMGLALARLALSNPTPQQADVTYPGFIHPTNGICTDYTVTETVTYSELQWTNPRFTNNYDVVAFSGNISRKGSLGADQPFGGVKNVTKTFDISGTFCKPVQEKDGKETTVLVATHGSGFDRRYWASSYKPEKYSFAQYALNAGYSIFYYDRLGVGHSSRISGFENQAAPQIELLAQIVRAIRNNKYTQDIKAKKVALVGHSYGSSLSNHVVAKYPELVDAAALTGTGYPNPNDSGATSGVWVPSVFALRIAKTLPVASRPQFAETLDTGYLSFADMFSYVQAFLHQPTYEVAAAEYSFKVAQPLAIGEFLTLQSVVAPEYKGKVFVTSGQFDALICNGDCVSTYASGLQNQTYPMTKVQTYIQPGAGHGQNFESNAGDLYAEIVKFLGGS